MKVVAIGECTIDRYLDLGLERVGGVSLNVAVHARASGADHVALVSATGTDLGDDAVRAALDRYAIDASRVRLVPGETASQDILLRDGGERLFPPGGYRPGVLAGLELEDADWLMMRDADAVALPYMRQLSGLIEPVLRLPRWGALRVVDLLDGEDLGPGLRALDGLLATCDLLFLSAPPEEVDALVPRVREGRAILVVTHGALGSTALDGDRRFALAALPVDPRELVDTTGCGDAFQAAFTVAYLRERNIPGALMAGAARAALVLRHIGALPPVTRTR